MFRPISSSAISQPAIRCLSEEAKGDDYALYLLSDNSPETLEQTKQVMGRSNTILFCPDPGMSSTGSRRYVAKIYEKGILRATELMGERNFSDANNPPDVNNLIKAALAKAGMVVVAPLLQSIQPVFRQLAPDINNSSLGSFARTSLFANHLAQPVLDQRLMNELKELFGHIREGNFIEVKKMLDANPRLSLAKWKAAKEEEKIITNKADQRIYVEGKTGYQFALGEEDTEMAKIFKEAILKVADIDEANKQFGAQYPDGWEKDEEKEWKPVFAQLEMLTQAVRTATPEDIISSGDPEYKLTVKPGSTVEKLFKDYTDSLNKRLKEVVTTGRHFNPNLLLGLFEKYDKHFADFGNRWDDPRAMFYWQRVIGQAQHLMTANLVQAFCDPEGLNAAAEKLRTGAPCARSFKFKSYDSASSAWIPTDFYPVAAAGLGSNFALFDGRRCAGAGAGLLGCATLCVFEAYVNQKQQSHRAYATPRP